nr:cellulose synthase catalytic subunit [Actinopolymorpha cephalotaxi]
MLAPVRQTKPTGGELFLPTAPSDAELYAYLGPQRRWVLLVMTGAFACASISLFRFSTHQWILAPFLCVLALNAVCTVISLRSGQNTRRISRVSHQSLTGLWNPARIPSVDVFLPTAGEPLEVLANTYAHVAAMSWPGTLRVYVLDDSAREEVERAALAAGFTYLSRPDRGQWKKAGNLRFGFDHSDGDLIAVFDADFCPRPDYLFHLVPYLDDPKVGIAQSPQCFETRPEMGWLQRTAGATQELFYRWVQPSRDAAGAPICVGTCAVYRRSALAEVGGFALIEHSEDVHTGVKLLSGGYVTRYVPVQIARGMCPDDLAGFCNQQYRWCTGSMSLLASKDFHSLSLTWRQRACFWSGFLYYVSTAVNVFLLHLPGLVMEFGYPEDIRASHFLVLLPAAWVWLVLLPVVFRSRWRFEVLRVQMVYSFAHAVAIWHVLRGRTAGWVPTGSLGAGGAGSGGSGGGGGNGGGSGARLARTITIVAVVWLGGYTIAAWVGIVAGVMTYGLDAFWLMAAFVAGYTYLVVPLVLDGIRLLTGQPAGRRVAAAPSARRSAPVLTAHSTVTGAVTVDRTAE